MKKKKLALLLAVAMTVTSIDSTAMMVNAADFTYEEVQEQSVELTDEPSEATVETDAETEDGEVISDNSSEDESIEITDEPQESADTEGEDAEIDIQEEEETSPEDVFSAEDEIAVLNDEGGEEPATEDGESPATAVTLTPATEYEANIDEAGKTVWFKFTPAESGRYEIYSTGRFDTYVEFYGTNPAGTRIAENDDGNKGVNFSLKRNLEAGKTYYYRTKMYSEYVTGTFNVQIVQKKVLSVEATNVLTEGIAGTAFYTYADLTVKSADDTVISTQLSYNDSQVRVYDDSGYIGSISVSLTKDGQEYSLGKTLDAGIYTMKFVYKNAGEEEASVESAPYTVTIRDIEDIANSPLYKGSLSLNKTTEVSTPIKGMA